MRAKVIEIDDEKILFDNGVKLASRHDQNCCENHYLCFDDLTMQDFEGLEFDLSNEAFFTRIEGYGIALNPIDGHPVRIAGHGTNNGYYSSDLTLVISNIAGIEIRYDITECQDIDW